MDINMLLNNPQPIGFGAEGLAYDILVDDVVVFSSTYPGTVKIKGADSSLVHMPVTMHSDRLLATLDSLKQRGVDSTHYRIRGTFRLRVAKKHEFHFDRSIKAPLFIIPDLRLVHFSIEDFRLKKTELFFVTEVINDNTFPIEFRGFEYEVRITDDLAFSGVIADAVSIEAHDTATLILPVDVSNKELIDVAWSYLKEGKETPYSFNARLEVAGNNNLIRGSTMILATEGVFGELQNIKPRTRIFLPVCGL